MRFLRKRRSAPPSDEPESYWVSFTDVMAGLLLVFILATVALMLRLTTTQSALDAKIHQAHAQQVAFDAQVAAVNKAEKVRTKILDEAKDGLEAAGIRVIVNTDAAVLSIPTAALGFSSGSYTIEPKYKARAARIGQVLSDVIRKNHGTKSLDTIFIEGHTDGKPFRGPLGIDNWGLSTFRAISLWKLWGSELPASTRPGALKNGNGRPLFSVSGYADTRPIDGIARGTASHAADRRIDIRFTVIRPSSNELAKIASGFTIGDK